MDALMDHQTEVDAVVAGLLRPLIDQELSVVFYDMTTIRTEGHSVEADDVRQFGMAKEGLIARQVMLGVVQTGDGLPICHEVFAGNTAESPTLLPTLRTVLERFPSIRRVVLVADRGLLSLDNLEALSEIRLDSGEPLEFVLAVPGRRYSEFAELLRPFHAQHCARATAEVVGELAWRDLRLVVAHDPEGAAETRILRREKIQVLETQAAAWVGKLDAQDAGVKARGKRLSDSKRGQGKAVSRRQGRALGAYRSRGFEERTVLLRHRSRCTGLGGVDGWQVAAGDQLQRSGAAGHRGSLQVAGRYRAGFPGAEVRDRDRSAVSPLA
jgi:hypothetical protein